MGAGELLPPDAGDVVVFSETEAEAAALAGGVAAKIVTGGTCDMVESDNRYCSLCAAPTDDALCHRSLLLCLYLIYFSIGRCLRSLSDDSWLSALGHTLWS